MWEERRRVLTALGSFAGFVAAAEFIPSFLAGRASAQLPRNRRVPPSPKLEGGGTEFDIASGDKPAQQNVQYQSTLRADVEKLCAMANELKDQVVHINPHDMLSVTFLKKTEAIEKLAKQIRGHAIG